MSGGTRVQGRELAQGAILTSVPLPAGASTEATLQQVLAALGGPSEQLLSRTAFGEAAVAQRTPMAGWTFAYGVNGRHVRARLTGAGSAAGATNGQGWIRVTNAGETAILETRRSLRYVPGIGGLIEGTFRFPPLNPLLDCEFGIGGDADGFFIASRGGVLGFLRRANGAESFSPVANLDPAVFATLNPTLLHPIAIQYQWLGGGAIKYHLEIPSTGALTAVNIIAYAGTSTDTSVRNPNLPCRLAMTALPGYAGGAVQAFSPSAMAFQEGSETNAILSAAWPYGRLLNNVGTTELPVVTLHNQALFGGVTNRVTNVIRSLDLCVTVHGGTPRSALFRAWRGSLADITAALTAPTFAVAVNADSNTRADIAATAINTAAAGLTLVGEWRRIVPSDREVKLDPVIHFMPDECITFTATRGAGSGAVDAEVMANWQEPL